MENENGKDGMRSATSFCIAGIEIDESLFSFNAKNARDLLVQKGFNPNEASSMTFGELLYNLYSLMFGDDREKMFGRLVVVKGLSKYRGRIFIGIDISNMNDWETCGYFKESVLLLLVDKLGFTGLESDIGIFADGGEQ